MKELKTLILLCLILSSCDTRWKIYDKFEVWVHVKIDWSNLNQRPNGTTIAFYPQTRTDIEPIFLITNSINDSIRLPQDTYSVLVFNETLTGHDNIYFRGTTRYETFEAYIKPTTVSNKYYIPEGEYAVASPSILAIDRLENFRITQAAILSKARITLNFKPQRVLSTTILKVHIRGMNNVAKSGSSASISGLANGINLSTGRLSSTPVTQVFTLNNKLFESGSITQGTMSGSFVCFGIIDNEIETKSKTQNVQNLASLYFRLRNETDLDRIDRNVTGRIEVITEGNQIIYKVEIGLDVPSDPIIVLPDVPDTEKPGAGFDADVGDWGDEEVVDVPL